MEGNVGRGSGLTDALKGRRKCCIGGLKLVVGHLPREIGIGSGCGKGRLDIGVMDRFRGQTFEAPISGEKRGDTPPHPVFAHHRQTEGQCRLRQWRIRTSGALKDRLSHCDGPGRLYLFVRDRNPFGLDVVQKGAQGAEQSVEMRGLPLYRFREMRWDGIDWPE